MKKILGSLRVEFSTKKIGRKKRLLRNVAIGAGALGVLGGGAYLLSKRSQVPEKIRTKSSEATRLLVRRARIAKGRRVATLIRNNPWRKTDDWRPSAPQAIRIANGGPVENETIKTKSTRNSRAREAFKRKMSKGE